MRRLVADGAKTTLAEVLANLDLREGAHDDRPYVVSNFVLTLDGRATIEGRAGPIGSETDKRMLHGLRTVADAVMLGAGTMRAERYGRMVPDAEARARREERGLDPDPLAVIVSGSLELPWDAGLFGSDGRVLIFTVSGEEPPPTAAPLETVRHHRRVDLAAALAHLRRERGIRALLCEGGPRLHAELIEAGLIDELFVTLAPKLAGGEGLRLVHGLEERERRLALVSLLHEPETGELFARYALA